MNFLLVFSEILIEKRSSYIDHIAKKPLLPEGSPDPPNIELGFFPILDKNILNSEANLKYVTLCCLYNHFISVNS
jgi:hypothetical protein